MTHQFVTGQTYSAILANHKKPFSFKILSRTAKSVTFSALNETGKRRIETDENGEVFHPFTWIDGR